MTPAGHGYVQCARCGVWRQHEHIAASGPEPKDWHCIDVVWCGQQVGVGKGELTADTGDSALVDVVVASIEARPLLPPGYGVDGVSDVGWVASCGHGVVGRDAGAWVSDGYPTADEARAAAWKHYRAQALDMPGNIP